MRFCHTHKKDTNFKIYTDLNEVKQDWDGFLPHNHHLNSRNLLVLQESKLADISFAYLVVERKDQTIGVIYLQLVDFNSNHYSADMLKNSSFSLLKDFILKQKAAIIICGNLFRLDFPGFYFQNPDDQKNIFQVLKEFENQYKSKISYSCILLKDVPSYFPSEVAKKQRFKQYDKDLLMELRFDPKWRTFEDYVEELSKKYKQRANKITNAGKVLLRKSIISSDFEKYGNQIEDLYLNVVERQLFKVGKLNKMYFQEMLERPAKDFEIIGYFLGDKLLAFSSIFRHSPDISEIYYIGFDFKLNDTYSLYFNIIFDGIKDAIEKKISILKLGRTGYDAKLSAGAVPVATQHFYKNKRGLNALFLNFLVKAFSEKEESKMKERNPFKSRQMLESPSLENEFK